MFARTCLQATQANQIGRGGTLRPRATVFHFQGRGPEDSLRETTFSHGPGGLRIPPKRASRLLDTKDLTPPVSKRTNKMGGNRVPTSWHSQVGKSGRRVLGHRNQTDCDQRGRIRKYQDPALPSILSREPRRGSWPNRNGESF